MNLQGDYDLLIVGSGMVGASLAIALSGQGLQIGLVDAFAPGDPGQPGYDDRAIALAYGSRKIFEGMGLWEAIRPDAEPIEQIHVSDRGHFGFSRLSALEQQVPALGYVATARGMGRALLARLSACEDVELIAPADVIKVSVSAEQACLLLSRDGEQQQVQAPLVVAADGGNSFIREQLDVPAWRWGYGQTAVVANITPAKAHQNTAYERFTDTGPVALLPMSEGRCALVWTIRDEQLDAIMTLDERAFLAAFQARFGYRLGRFERVGKRQHYPLSLLRVRQSTAERMVIIGNAAHTLHPIAGQGFNLGLGDVAALAQVLTQAHQDGLDLGSAGVLAQYEQWRTGEQRTVALATDVLARLFSNPLASLKLGRNLGLLAVDLCDPLRHQLAHAAMGLSGRRGRLSLGLPVR